MLRRVGRLDDPLLLDLYDAGLLLNQRRGPLLTLDRWRLIIYHVAFALAQQVLRFGGALCRND